jgi:hypothetical protein
LYTAILSQINLRIPTDPYHAEYHQQMKILVRHQKELSRYHVYYSHIELLKACNLLYVNIKLYSPLQMDIYHSPKTTPFTLELFVDNFYYDSIISHETNLIYYNVGTWNVRGINNKTKQILLDEILLSYKIRICCIQEFRLQCRRLTTPNYTWILSFDKDHPSRGNGFLIHRSTLPFVTAFKKISPNQCYLILKFPHDEHEHVIVNVYGVNEGDPQNALEIGIN